MTDIDHKDKREEAVVSAADAAGPEKDERVKAALLLAAAALRATM